MKYVAIISFFIIFFLASCDEKDDPLYQINSFYGSHPLFGLNGSNSLTGDETDFMFPEISNTKSKSIHLSGNKILDNLNDTIWNYDIILPPSYYDSPEKFYPVIYLLHGLGSTANEMARNLKINTLLDYFYENELLPEMIAVFPDCGTTYWVDNYLDNICFESFFFNIFLPEIEFKYRIDTTIKRNIFGFSMGGYGAAHYAVTYPDLFGFCYSASGVLMGKGTTSTPSVFETAKNLDVNDKPFFIIDICQSDSFAVMNKLIHFELWLIAFNHECIVREGNHDWNFWKGSITACLYRLGRLYYNFY